MNKQCSADGGTIFLATGVAASAGCWVRQDTGGAWLYDWFGAVPDISVDSTSAINLANKNLNGHKLVFATGATYKITASINFPAGATDWSVDCQRAVIKQWADNTPIFVLQGDSNTVGFDIGYCNFGYLKPQPTSNTSAIAIDFGKPDGSGGLWTFFRIHDIYTGAGYGNEVFSVIARDPHTGGHTANIQDRFAIERINSSAPGGIVHLIGGTGGASGGIINELYGFGVSAAVRPFVTMYGCNGCTYSNIDRTGYINGQSVNQPLVYAESGANQRFVNNKTENETYSLDGLQLIRISNSYNNWIEGLQIVTDTINMPRKDDNFCLTGDTSANIRNAKYTLTGAASFDTITRQGTSNLFCLSDAHSAVLRDPTTWSFSIAPKTSLRNIKLPE